MLHRFVVVYLDDTLIFSRDLTEHKQQVRLVLRRLWENTLFIKAEKCSFHTDSSVSWASWCRGFNCRQTLRR